METYGERIARAGWGKTVQPYIYKAAISIANVTAMTTHEALTYVLSALSYKPQSVSLEEALVHAVSRFNGDVKELITSNNFDPDKQRYYSALNTKETKSMNKIDKVIELVEEAAALDKQIRLLNSTGLDDVNISIYFPKEDDAMTITDKNKLAVIDLVVHNLQQRSDAVTKQLDSVNVALNMVTGL